MIYKCPGQDRRFLKINYITCPNCAYQAEIFSDETRVRCPGCGGVLRRETMPSCANWCKQARECIGEERWRQLVESRLKA